MSVLTSLSLSAISTDIRVKVGGVYYLISRTLGLEFGGAIGLVMFLAQSISIAFYCIGFGEALAAILSVDNVKVFSQLAAAAAVLVLFAFAWLGADWATRFQYVVMVILGAALVSFFVGAPRILQSLASDRIFPFLVPFAKGAGPSHNPRRAVLLSLVIAVATIGLGRLNIIAPVVSMFFLISYGLLNYATYYEARSASPSFRPRFRWYHRRVSLIGGLACLGIMLTIDVTAAAVSTALLFAVYQYLKRTSGPARWADSQRAYHLQQVREHLLAAGAVPEHPRSWRPYVLLFSDDSHRRKNLLDFASWVQGQSGFTTAVRILEGQGVKILKERQVAEAEDAAREAEASGVLLPDAGKKSS